jgi:hypothetical protein
MNDDDKPKPKLIYSRDRLTPDTPLVQEPEKAPAPELTPEQIERRLAILDRLGVRIVSSRIVTPIEPSEKMMHALADLRLDLPVLLVKEQGPMHLYYGLLEKGWLETWDKHGWRGIEKNIRNAITQMA